MAEKKQYQSSQEWAETAVVASAVAARVAIEKCIASISLCRKSGRMGLRSANCAEVRTE